MEVLKQFYIESLVLDSTDLPEDNALLALLQDSQQILCSGRVPGWMKARHIWMMS
jgi:hypothetical protein